MAVRVQIVPLAEALQRLMRDGGVIRLGKDQPRHPKGTSLGGQFAPKHGGKGGGKPPSDTDFTKVFNKVAKLEVKMEKRNPKAYRKAVRKIQHQEAARIRESERQWKKMSRAARRTSIRHMAEMGWAT